MDDLRFADALARVDRASTTPIVSATQRIEGGRQLAHLFVFEAGKVILRGREVWPASSP
jgi:hypothetical protein